MLEEIKIKIYSLAVVGKFGLFSGDFDRNPTDLVKKTSQIFRMSEEKMKKCLNVNFFILVWNNFGWSEDSSSMALW